MLQSGALHLALAEPNARALICALPCHDTARRPTMMTNINEEETNDTTDPEDDDDTGYCRTLTDKLVRSFRLHQQKLARHNTPTLETTLTAHHSHQMQFWEVCASETVLATHKEELGCTVRTSVDGTSPNPATRSSSSTCTTTITQRFF